MSQDAAWPPKSPHAALLSSPSGRKKYTDGTHERSPMKPSATTPGLLERLRAARADKDILPGQVADEEEDEETLQLQLAAIEAKLKLKKIQQNKARVETDRQTLTLSSSRPASAAAVPTLQRYGVGSRGKENSDDVQVTLSPTKRAIQPLEPRSPSRVLLGIDKGLKASDVSLKRAKSTIDYGSKRAAAASTTLNSSNSRTSTMRSDRSTATQTQAGSKSFSERMAFVRDGDRARDIRRDAIIRGRNNGFKLDAKEVEEYRAAAEQSNQRPRSPVKPYQQPGYSREDILLAKTAGERGLKKSRTLPNLRQSPSRPASRGQDSSFSQGDASLYEGLSGIDLASRILPHSFLKRTLPEEQYKIYTVKDLLKDVTSPDYEMPDDVGEYVVFGIIATKSAPRDHKQKGEEQSVSTTDWERKWEDGSQNTRKFMILTLTDLDWSLDLFLFGTAVPRYHRLTPGTVVAILNPTIMPPKKGREDTGAFSLTLHNGEDTVLEVGQARNLGFCNATRKDGKECGQWVNAAKTEICEFHLNLQLYKTQSSRMGVNGGYTAFGGIGEGSKSRNNIFDSRRKGIGEGEGRGGLLPQKGGKDYKQFVGHYYVGGAAPAGIRAPGSNAPFQADMQDSRDKKTLLRKQREALGRESEVAEKLGLFDTQSAGSNYLRKRNGNSNPAPGHGHGNDGSQRSSITAKSQIMGSKSNANRNGKRVADSVRLSPIKKTRFLTEKGIREAGRESLGVPNAGDDDDLDIV